MNRFHFSHRLFSSLSSRACSTSVTERAVVMSATSLKAPRVFAPLKGVDDETTEGAPKLKGVVFDVDGTLW
jgi:hypothetical protein